MSSLERLLYPDELTALGSGSQRVPRDSIASAGWERTAVDTQGN